MSKRWAVEAEFVEEHIKVCNGIHNKHTLSDALVSTMTSFAFESFDS
jgi:hypothetical protein